ncbi:MAG: alkaline phosphatase family protein [Myxococcales bacterium]|nr:alkaline phosphatase family protein [Myxococcales bacterium]MCB9709520.1 alkaline phosphatase family protein [Myxococcales bacterium]
MTAQSLIIGLDGADWDVIEALGSDQLPTLHGLRATGTHARLQSVQPPATLPNWTTFLTGVGPGAHGVFDFTIRNGYNVRFTGGSVREVPTVFSRLDRLGRRTACVAFPGTWPSEPLEHGVYISGWDAPVAFEADASYVWPRSLHASILRRFGALRFDTVDEFHADHSGWHDRLPQALEARIEQKTALANWLLEQNAWHLFAVYFGESDTASHYLWSLHDNQSPRRPGHCLANQTDGLARIYRALDHSVATLLQAAGGPDRVELTIVSDHGSGGSSDKALYLNRLLAEWGFLHFKPRTRLGPIANRAKQLALDKLAPRVRHYLFEKASRRLPSMLESYARYGHIDMARTRIFSDELNYFPSLHFNLRGREPLGLLHPHDVPDMLRDLTRALCAVRDPWSDEPVIKSVHERGALFHGPFLHRAPDLLLELHLDNGYSYNLLPSGSFRGEGAWRRLKAEEYLGKKGRSLPGSHRDHGVYLASGPRVRIRGECHLRMADAMGHVLSRLEPWVQLPDIPAPAPLGISSRTRNSFTSSKEAQIAARLRQLGYID